MRSERAVLGSAGRGQDLNGNPAGIDGHSGLEPALCRLCGGTQPTAALETRRAPPPAPAPRLPVPGLRQGEKGGPSDTRERSQVWLRGGNRVSKPEAWGCAAASGKEPGARGSARRRTPRETLRSPPSGKPSPGGSRSLRLPSVEVAARHIPHTEPGPRPRPSNLRFQAGGLIVEPPLGARGRSSPPPRPPLPNRRRFSPQPRAAPRRNSRVVITHCK